MKKFVVPLLFLFIVSGCKKNNDNPEKLEIGSPPEGYIVLTYASISGSKNYTGNYALIGDTNYVTRATVYLNDELIDANEYKLLDEPGFYTLEIQGEGNDIHTIQFVILDPARKETDWGLKTWVPQAFEINTNVEGQLDIIYPKRHIAEINLPVVVYNLSGNKINPAYYSLTNSVNTVQDYVKRGVGSLNIDIENNYSFTITIGNITENINVDHVSSGWTTIPTTISDEVTIPANSFVHLTEDINITTGGSLNIQQGSVIVIDQGINIHTAGPVDIQGSKTNPVLITCSNPDSFWGGIIANGDAADITLQYAFINQGGYNTGSEYEWGHAKRQAAIYTNQADLNADHCYFLDHIGQVFYPVESEVILRDILVQRAKTTGQLNSSEVTVDNCIFTDFPEYSDQYMDYDNDALYLNLSNASITNSTFMYAKDDGLDTGTDSGGEVTVDSCWFEGMFHEGIAMSSAEGSVKSHHVSNSTFTNCGQGIELGFSSEYHVATVENCLAFGNLIGIRYGDCYPWTQEGQLIINNTQSIHNIDKDIWNMSRACWCPRLENTILTNVQISIPSDQYPGLEVINE